MSHLVFQNSLALLTVPYFNQKGEKEDIDCAFIPNESGARNTVEFRPQSLSGTLVLIPEGAAKPFRPIINQPIGAPQDEHFQFTLNPTRIPRDHVVFKTISKLETTPKHERYAYVEWLKGLAKAASVQMSALMHDANGTATPRNEAENMADQDPVDPNMREMSVDYSYIKKSHFRTFKNGNMTYVSPALGAPENYDTMDDFLNALDNVVDAKLNPEKTMRAAAVALDNNPNTDKTKLDEAITAFLTKIPLEKKPTLRFSPRLLAKAGITDRYFIYKATTLNWQEGSAEEFYARAVAEIKHKPGYSITAQELSNFRGLTLGDSVASKNATVALAPSVSASYPSHVIRDLYGANSLGQIKTKEDMDKLIAKGMECHNAYVAASGVKQAKRTQRKEKAASPEPAMA